MVFLVYAATADHSIAEFLGKPEYSYYFVLKEFLPVLQRLGIVIRVTDPAREADEVYRNCRAHGQECVLLSFAPPHKTTLGLECPTIPVFAWEFATIPNEPWLGEPRNDWTYVLGQLRQAITHSTFSRRVVADSIGPGLDIVSIPAPVWDRFAARRAQSPSSVERDAVELVVRGKIVDSRLTDLSFYSAELPYSAVNEDLYELRLDGLVYTSIFNPEDSRKNWFDMINGFCWAFRDVEDATLILKLTNSEPEPWVSAFLGELYKQSPMKCRVVVIDGFLEDADYERLADATTYVYNTAHGEGQCLPLMEYMSLGKPAVAPRHTAMADYVDETNSFIVKSSLEPAMWPQDERRAFRTLRHRIDFESLVVALRESHRVATTDPARYASMSGLASEALRRFCSHAVVEEKLRALLMPEAVSCASR